MFKEKIVVDLRSSPEVSDSDDKSDGDKIGIRKNGREQVVSGKHRDIEDQELLWCQESLDASCISSDQEPDETRESHHDPGKGERVSERYEVGYPESRISDEAPSDDRGKEGQGNEWSTLQFSQERPKALGLMRHDFSALLCGRGEGDGGQESEYIDDDSDEQGEAYVIVCQKWKCDDEKHGDKGNVRPDGGDNPFVFDFSTLLRQEITKIGVSRREGIGTETA